MMIGQYRLGFFQLLSDQWGPYTVDLFADNVNHKVCKFYSRYWTEGTAGVDAFAHDWQFENCWAVPPVGLVGRVIKHIVRYRAHGTLIVPYWLSASFWPLISNGRGQFLWFIVNVKLFNTKGIFQSGSVQSMFNKNFNGSVLALKFDAR